MSDMNMISKQRKPCSFKTDAGKAYLPCMASIMTDDTKDAPKKRTDELDLAAWVDDVPY